MYLVFGNRSATKRYTEGSMQTPQLGWDSSSRHSNPTAIPFAPQKKDKKGSRKAGTSNESILLVASVRAHPSPVPTRIPELGDITLRQLGRRRSTLSLPEPHRIPLPSHYRSLRTRSQSICYSSPRRSLSRNLAPFLTISPHTLHLIFEDPTYMFETAPILDRDPAATQTLQPWSRSSDVTSFTLEFGAPIDALKLLLFPILRHIGVIFSGKTTGFRSIETTRPPSLLSISIPNSCEPKNSPSSW